MPSRKQITLTLALLSFFAINNFSSFSKLFAGESKKNSLTEIQERIRSVMEYFGLERDTADLIAITGVFLFIIVMCITCIIIICRAWRGEDEEDQNAPAPQVQDGQQGPRNQDNNDVGNPNVNALPPGNQQRPQDRVVQKVWKQPKNKSNKKRWPSRSGLCSFSSFSPFAPSPAPRIQSMTWWDRCKWPTN